ncbi:heavy metal translocatin [Favolaschia claudopus]|uniref:Heavy metal translocatin n=1 Tax=Favolaschia claudopus TaxID=2862362 RepID=A0AAW0CRD9_9AGAR
MRMAAQDPGNDGSGCRLSPPGSIQESIPNEGDAISCEDECCQKALSIHSVDSEYSCERGCCATQRDDKTTDECCNKNEETVSAEKCDNGCCAIEKVDDEVSCEDECCKTAEPTSDPCEKGCCRVLQDDEPVTVACNQGCCSDEVDECTTEEMSCDEDDDDSLCPCCVEILVQHPNLVGRTRTEAEMVNPTLFPKNSVHRLSTAIRKCCRLFESTCAQKSCCFSSSLPPKPRRTIPKTVPSQCKQPAPLPADRISNHSIHSSLDDSSAREPLKLEITGMDCADCCIKINRALSRLPSIKGVHLSYIEAIATFTYDPEILNPEAIARYVARATGFSITPVGNEDRLLPSTHIVLPVTFSRMPPAHVLEPMNPRHRKELGGFTEISFPIRGEGARQPRQVLAELADYDPKIVSSDVLRKMDDRASQDLRRIALRTLCIVLLSIPVLVITWAKIPGSSLAHGVASAVLTTLIQALALPILSSSLRSIIFLHAIDMSVLVSVSSLSAWIFSLVSFAFEAAGRPFAEPFFETVALLLSLVHIGRVVQAATRRATRSATRELEQCQPKEVILVEQVGSSTIETVLDARLLYYGDIVRLRPAARIATDGIVVSGSSSVDESSITGESIPSAKQVGSSVAAGTLNLDGTLDIQITQLIHENYLARIGRLVHQAQATRSRFQDLADRFSAIVLPVSAVCAAIAFVTWFFVNRYGKHLSSSNSAVGGLTYALAILIVSCPCAIGVAVPLVVAAALRAGLREGILFRSSEALQKAHNVDAVVFDKTGTLSCGLFSLQRKEFLVPGASNIIHPLVSSNQHPISKAVSMHLAALQPDNSIQSPEIESLPGMGVRSILAGYPLHGGNPKFTGSTQHPIVQEFTARGLTLFTVTLAGELVAAFGLSDMPRADASPLLTELSARGKEIFLLSGDNARAVARFATMLPIEPSKAQAACTPADKAEFISALQARGRRVCFVGDGTNDAPALAQADVSLCITSGADVAIAAAGALVAGERMQRGVLAALDIAKDAQHHMVAALGWCVLYNTAALLLAGGVFLRVRIEPQWAGLGELVGLVPVLIVGLALDLRWRWRRK